MPEMANRLSFRKYKPITPLINNGDSYKKIGR